MSRLKDLLRELKSREPALARDLEVEFSALAERRAFGLNFERHVPETVELPGRPVRKGDKVRILPPRGELPKKSNEIVWRVISVDRTRGHAKLLPVSELAKELNISPTESGEFGAKTREVEIDDLVVVAEFRDSIYPGLLPSGKVERGGDKPFHVVINAENFHGLETLLFTHRSRVDCIYIDPPYNSGAKDWKYNNDYVEKEDLYRHSKWLAFMERRLLVAKELLSPSDSVLIVTIDEKEYLRLGLLLEQVFPEARIQMVSAVINPKGAARASAFGRTDEYLFFVMLGKAAPIPLSLSTEWKIVQDKRAEGLRWAELQRSGTDPLRSDSPNQFYPIFIRNDTAGPVFHSVGEPYFGNNLNEIVPPAGTTAVWPIRADGSEGRWSNSSESLRTLIEKGYARLGKWRSEDTAVTYLAKGEQRKVESGEFPIVGRKQDNSIVVDSSEYTPVFIPGTQWRIASHNAEQGGTNLLKAMMPDRKFPFPKSLYAVEDALRFFVANKPKAVVLDFFSGSGTTAHALMRLNRQDGGRRQCISITNNEVGAEEQKGLRDNKLRPGDRKWEEWGICNYILKPRITAAITGKTTFGEPIQGDYKFTDKFPIGDGFEENVEFFDLTYEAPLRVASNREFAKIAPLLWIRAGARGRRIENITKGWDVADTYGVLADLDQTDKFIRSVAKNKNLKIAFIVTDDDRLFESISQDLPAHVEPVRLYEAYLRNFEINTGRGAP